MVDYAGIGALQGALKPGSNIPGYIQSIENIGFNRQKEQRAEEAHDMKLEIDSANLIAKYQDIEKTGMELEVTKAEQAGKLADAEIATKLAQERVNLLPDMTQIQKNQWQARVADSGRKMDASQKQFVFQQVGGIYDEQGFAQARQNLEQQGINPADVGMPETYDPNKLTQYKQAIKTSLVANQKIAETEAVANLEREQQSILNDQQNAFTAEQNRIDWENRFAIKALELGHKREIAKLKGTKNVVTRKDYPQIDEKDAITLVAPAIKELGGEYTTLFGGELSDKGKAVVTQIVLDARSKWDREMKDYEQSGGNPALQPDDVWTNIRKAVKAGAVKDTAEEQGIQSIMNTREFKNNPDIKKLPEAVQYEEARKAWRLKQQMGGMTNLN